jgi:hypothetical protein
MWPINQSIKTNGDFEPDSFNRVKGLTKGKKIRKTIKKFTITKPATTTTTTTTASTSTMYIIIFRKDLKNSPYQNLQQQQQLLLLLLRLCSTTTTAKITTTTATKLCILHSFLIAKMIF